MRVRRLRTEEAFQTRGPKRKSGCPHSSSYDSDEMSDGNQAQMIKNNKTKTSRYSQFQLN